MQRLTDIWRELLGRQEADDDENEHSHLMGRRLSQAQSQELTESYRNLYWTGLVSMQQEDLEPRTMRRLGDDIISELTELEEEDAEIQDQWEPLFDPQRL